MALLKRKDVLSQTTLGAELLYRLMREGKFPKPIHLTPHRVAWDSEEVEEWVSDLKEKRDAKQAAARRTR